jgi:hypothetical protein
MTTILNSKHTIPISNGGAVSGTFLTSQFNGTSSSSSGQVYTNGTTTVPNGAYLTTTGTNTVWTTGTNSISNSEVMRINQTNPPTLEVKGKMVVNGRDLEERLETIEKVLQIPERDVILEKKHPKLKKLYDEYIAALGKYRTFNAIKGD